MFLVVRGIGACQRMLPVACDAAELDSAAAAAARQPSGPCWISASSEGAVVTSTMRSPRTAPRRGDGSDGSEKVAYLMSDGGCRKPRRCAVSPLTTLTREYNVRAIQRLTGRMARGAILGGLPDDTCNTATAGGDRNPDNRRPVVRIPGAVRTGRI